MKLTRTLMTTLYLVAVLFLLPGTALSEIRSTKVKIGSATLKLPDVEGFSNSEQLPYDSLKMVYATVPDINRLLALYVSNDDVAKILNGQPPTFYRYIMIQTSRQYEDSVIDSDGFKVLAGQVKSEHESLLSMVKDELKGEYDKISKSFSRYFNTAIDLGLTSMVPLGVFIDREKAVGFASMARVTTVVDNVPHDSILVGATSLVNVRGKLLFVYVYSGFSGDGDVDWVRSTTTWITDQIIKLARWT